MAEYITKIRTEDGDKQIDYTALANLPSSDTSLSKSGEFADAKAVGDAISVANETINNITPADIDAVPITRKVNGKELSSDITLSATDVGASSSGHIHDDRYYTESEIDTKLSGKSDTNHTHNYAGSSSAGGSANSAVKLAAAKTIRTDLASTTAVGFDGSSNVTPGVTGILPIIHGGLGADNVAGALANLGLTKYYASANGSASSLSLSNTVITKLTLDNWKVNSGNKFTFSDGGIVMPKDGIVLICAGIYFNSATTSTPCSQGPYIFKNNVEIAGLVNYVQFPTTVGLAPFITEVAAGDVITLHGRSSGRDGSCMPNGGATALTVIYL